MSPTQAHTTGPLTARSSRVETTLFLLMSVDGKITSGETDNLDSGRDWKRIRGVKEGLQQYYQIEWSIAINSLNTGRVMAKIGVNSRTETPEKDDRLTFFIIEHRIELLLNLVEWVFVMHKGRIIAEGPPDSITDDERVVKAYLGD